MALASRRLASLALSTAVAVIGGLAAQAGVASAADPITNQSAPTLTGPANNTTTPVKDVVLTWTAVTYATKYQIQISPNGDWTNNTITLPHNNTTINTSYEVPVSLPHDEYEWRVRALDANGHTAWSSSRSFFHDWAAALTVLQAPTATDPTLAWAPVPEASIYRVRFSTDPSFEDKSAKTGTCWTSNTSLTLYTLQSDKSKEKTPGDCMDNTVMVDNKTYYWDVRAFDDSTAATIQADTANDQQWDCPAPQPECDALDAGSSIIYTAPLAGTVSTGTVTGLGTTWHTGSLPGTDCTDGDCAATPTFSWDAVPGANYYRVHVYRDAFATNTYRVYDTQWPSVTPRDDFFDADAGAGYYWVVQAGTCTNSDTDPSCGTPILTGDDADTPPSTADTRIVFNATSAVSTFGKTSGAVPLVGPSNNAVTTGRNVTFSWGDFLSNGGNDAYDARNYRVQVARDDAFDDTVWDFSDVDMTQFTNPSGSLADGQYFWRVQPIDESGNGLDWSATRSFTKDGSPPVFHLTDKDGVPTTGHLHVVVNESDLVGNVSQSTLNVVPVAGNGPALAGAWAKTGSRHWTFTPAKPLTVGQSYALEVVGNITDEPGNLGTATARTVRVARTADDKTKGWSFSGGWSRHSSSNAILGTYERGRSGAAASIRVVGKSVAVYGCKGPTLGKLKVQVDGVTKRTVDEHQSFTRCGMLLWRGAVGASSVHTVRVTATGGPATFDAVRVG